MADVEFYPQQTVHERRSAVLTLILVIVALFLGWQVKTAVQTANRTVTQAGVTAAVPAGWLVQSGAGDLLLLARNPEQIHHLYRVSRMAALSDLDTVAIGRNQSRAQLDDSYRVLEATPVILAGQSGYKVGFARAHTSSPGMPYIVEGVDYYFRHGDQVLIISLEARSDTFAAALPHFQRFVQSVSYRPGE
jgi:hypothetical protein